MTASDVVLSPKASLQVAQRQIRHKNKQTRKQKHLVNICSRDFSTNALLNRKHISLLTNLPKQLHTCVTCSVSLNVALFLSRVYLMTQRKTDIV